MSVNTSRLDVAARATFDTLATFDNRHIAENGHTAEYGRFFGNGLKLAGDIGRYVGHYLGVAGMAVLVCLAMVLPVKMLPSPHDNVFAALTFLSGLAWFVALNYIRKPMLAILFISLGVITVIGSWMALVNSAWMVGVWITNTAAGVFLLAITRWVPSVPVDRALAWVSFNVTLLSVLGWAV